MAWPPTRPDFGRMTRRWLVNRPGRLPRASIVLALAILPMLLFVDHWAMADHHHNAGIETTMLATARPSWLHAHHWGHQHSHGATGVQSSAGHSGHQHSTNGKSAKDSSDEAHDHAQHCHINSASCSDVPLTSIGGFGLLERSMALLGAGALVIAIWGGCWEPGDDETVGPDPYPPRNFLTTSI